MRRASLKRLAACMLTCCAAFGSVIPTANACSRFVYLGQDSNIFTARSMDWDQPISTDLYIFPRGYGAEWRIGAEFHSLDIEIWISSGGYLR